ncbi:MAG: hypothetical protein WB542_14680 [Polaromonas sp.]
MEIFILLTLAGVAAYTFKSRDQSRRIALLGSHLSKYEVEKLMESLTEGYLRALGEKDPERREQIWHLLNTTEMQLCDQFNRFAAEFSKVDEAEARVSTLPVAIPFGDKLFPNATFDLRKALVIHAQGITDAAKNSLHLAPKGKAFTLSAELFLMQHTCHWFCKSRTTASARMLARHKTSYEQLIESVAPATRIAYCSLIQG